MKILLIFSLFLAMAPRSCQEESEEGWEEETIDGVGYVAEDIKVRKAVAEWEKFKQESYAAVSSAQNQIARAADRADDPHLKHKGKFRALVFKAEAQLENLSDKLLGADRFDIEGFDYDEETLRKMKGFQEETVHKREKLNETLKELKSSEFYRP